MEVMARLTPSWFDVDGAGFLLAPLDGAQFINVQQASESAKTRGDAMRLAVEYSVKNWRGITSEGSELEYSRDNFDLVFNTPEVLAVVAGEIIKRSRLSRADSKKS